MARRIVYTAIEIGPDIRKYNLLGEEEGDIAELVMSAGESERNPKIQEILQRYGQNVIIAPLLTRRGTIRQLKRGEVQKVGIYKPLL